MSGSKRVEARRDAGGGDGGGGGLNHATLMEICGCVSRDHSWMVSSGTLSRGIGGPASIKASLPPPLSPSLARSLTPVWEQP